MLCFHIDEQWIVLNWIEMIHLYQIMISFGCFHDVYKVIVWFKILSDDHNWINCDFPLGFLIFLWNCLIFQVLMNRFLFSSFLFFQLNYNEIVNKLFLFYISNVKTMSNVISEIRFSLTYFQWTNTETVQSVISNLCLMFNIFIFVSKSYTWFKWYMFFFQLSFRSWRTRWLHLNKQTEQWPNSMFYSI